MKTLEKTVILLIWIDKCINISLIHKWFSVEFEKKSNIWHVGEWQKVPFAEVSGFHFWKPRSPLSRLDPYSLDPCSLVITYATLNMLNSLKGSFRHTSFEWSEFWLLNHIASWDPTQIVIMASVTIKFFVKQ